MTRWSVPVTIAHTSSRLPITMKPTGPRTSVATISRRSATITQLGRGPDEVCCGTRLQPDPALLAAAGAHPDPFAAGVLNGDISAGAQLARGRRGYVRAHAQDATGGQLDAVTASGC